MACDKAKTKTAKAQARTPCFVKAREGGLTRLCWGFPIILFQAPQFALCTAR